MNILTRLACSLLLLAWGVTGSSSQTVASDVSKSGTTAATFLEIPVGATAIGMGSAYVSVADDATSLYWNPSGIASIPQYNFMAVHTNWIADTKFDFGGLVLPIGDIGTLGFGVTILSMGDMKVRTVDQPEGTGEYFSAGDLAVGLTYARKLSDRFAVGFTGKYIQETIWHEQASAFALDIGTSFRTDLFGGMMIGATLSNFGTPMQMSGRDTRQFISVDPANSGSNFQVPSDIEMDSWNLPLLFQIGVSTNVVKQENYRWTVAVDALHPNDNYESMNMGAEFAYQEELFIRGGYESLFLPDAEGGFSFGFGVNTNNVSGNLGLSFEYAYRNMGRLDNTHTFSMGIAF
ncbi:MAG TPA: PorV/PorQ family protein [Bacteroidota bacterium]|nr:PorV/PorQ family protein [Bacteroidota bacterium]